MAVSIWIAVSAHRRSHAAPPVVSFGAVLSMIAVCIDHCWTPHDDITVLDLSPSTSYSSTADTNFTASHPNTAQDEQNSPSIPTTNQRNLHHHVVNNVQQQQQSTPLGFRHAWNQPLDTEFDSRSGQHGWNAFSQAFTISIISWRESSG